MMSAQLHAGPGLPRLLSAASGVQDLVDSYMAPFQANFHMFN